MTYTPIFSDIGELDDNSPYNPSVNDIPDETYHGVNDVMSELSKQTSDIGDSKPTAQEEFSNPTQFPGFDKLSPQEKIERIKFSQFDPANLDPGGNYLPPGTLDQPYARMAASTLPQAFVPEISSAGRFLSPILNSLSRIGTGAASNTAYEASNLDIKNMNDLQNSLSRNIGLNSLLEAGSMPFRGAGLMAETFNPIDYANSKAQQIEKETAATKAVTDSMYAPVNQKYNDFPVTLTPKEYLDKSGIDRSDLYADAKIVYDNFLNEPIFSNLHDLQSKLGSDWARASQSPATEEKAQLFKQMRESAKGKVQNFLSRDKESLKQYNDASDYAKNNYFPYLKIDDFKKSPFGEMDETPNSLQKNIQGALKDKTTPIPADHPLRNHLSDLNNKINFGNFAKVAIPTLSGGLVGSYLHPDMAGLLSGLGGGLGGGAISSFLGKFGYPGISGAVIQNPWVQNAMRNFIRPAYYKGGRTLIGSTNQNQ